MQICGLGTGRVLVLDGGGEVGSDQPHCDYVRLQIEGCHMIKIDVE